MTTTKFPILYKQGAKKILVWEIYAIDDRYFTSNGTLDGKMTDPGDGTLCTYKNKGRSNERTPSQQAIFEAESKWKKKLATGYFPQEDDLEGVKRATQVLNLRKKVGSNSKGGKIRDTKKMFILDEIPEHHNVKIMKGPPYDPNKHDISQGGFVQRKFDGYRCKVSVNSDLQVCMTTSQGSQIVFLEKLKNIICTFYKNIKKYKTKDIVLDGELFVHNPVDENGEPLKDVFNFATSCISTNASKPHPLEDQICYRVFDLDMDETTQKQRLKILFELFETFENDQLKPAKTTFVKDVDKLNRYLNKFLKEGYEGLIWRRAHNHYYHGKRTAKDCEFFKMKKMEDAEFQVVDFTEGKGKQKGCVVWICETENGQEFRAKQIGSFEKSREYFENGNEYVGEMLTVTYQELTKDGIPRMPVAKGFRIKGDL